MHGGRGSEASVNGSLKKEHAKNPNGFVIKSKINNC